MRKPTLFRKALTIAVMLTVGSFYSLLGTAALAQTAKAAGELTVSGAVTLNGTPAIAGATVFSDSKIKTASNGSATINLGKQGRVQLGPDSEMTVRFGDGSVGGNLTAGRAVVSAPAGTAISIATADGVATADGKKAATLTVDTTCGNTRVAALRSEAKVTAGSKVETVAAGNEVAVGQATTGQATTGQAGAPRCARLTTQSLTSSLSGGAIAALIIAGVGGAVAGIVAASQSDNVTPSSIVVSGFRP